MLSPLMADTFSNIFASVDFTVTLPAPPRRHAATGARTTTVPAAGDRFRCANYYADIVTASRRHAYAHLFHFAAPHVTRLLIAPADKEFMVRHDGQ
jgi:hypothetical protein